jgi:hypothetical protein
MDFSSLAFILYFLVVTAWLMQFIKWKLQTCMVTDEGCPWKVSKNRSVHFSWHRLKQLSPKLQKFTTFRLWKHFNCILDMKLGNRRHSACAHESTVHIDGGWPDLELFGNLLECVVLTNPERSG